MRERSLIQLIVQEIVNVIVVIALAWFLIFSFFRTVEVSGHSMEPVLSSSELVLVDSLRYRFMKPRRFDIVLFRKSDDTDNIKRVIGLPGETIIIQNGHIYIDGKLLESTAFSDITIAGIAENPVKLGKDEYFLIGDNTDSSEDSRFSNVGNVNRAQISGRVWCRVLPVSKIGFPENVT